MQGSVIRRMYAGFTLIVVLFVITIGIMLNGMSQIHDNFGSVSNTSLPLVSMSNQTSVELLSADKSFKDFLTTQNEERMALRREEFSASMQSFGSALEELAQVSQGFPELEAAITELRDVQTRYDQEAQVAMDNYQSMFAAQEQVQQSTRRFQKLNTDLSVGMKEYVDDASSISVKVMAKSYFIKLKDAELITSDALASSDTTFVQDAVNKNRKAVTHLNYAFNGLATQMPALKKAFEASVQQFSKDVGQKGGVLDQHNNYLIARAALYQNIENLAIEVDGAMETLNGFNEFATGNLNQSLANAGDIYDQGVIKAIGIGLVVTLIAVGIGYHIAQSVRQPLNSTLKTLESLTEGDMTQRIEVKYNNEFRRLGNHINTLADSLHNVLVKLNDASDNLTETASSNQATSASAQQQLSAQREQTANVATAMTEMSHSVQEVANSAQSSLSKFIRSSLLLSLVDKS